MIDSHEIIEHDCNDEQWNAFEQKIEMLEPKELAAIADRLNLQIDPEEPWQTFRDAFGAETWRDFTLAYEHVMYEPY